MTYSDIHHLIAFNIFFVFSFNLYPLASLFFLYCKLGISFVVSDKSSAIDPFEYFLYPENTYGQNNAHYYPLPKTLDISTQSSIISKFERLIHMYKSESIENRLQMNAFFCQILMDIYREGLRLRSKDKNEEKTEQMLKDVYE